MTPEIQFPAWPEKVDPQEAYQDRKEENELIDQTLTRSEWEEKMKETELLKSQEEEEKNEERVRKENAEFLASIEKDEPIKEAGLEDDNEEETNSDAYDLYKRWNKYRGRKKAETA